VFHKVPFSLDSFFSPLIVRVCLEMLSSKSPRYFTGRPRGESNNRVTFPIRRTALIDAIPLANKHIKPYEND